MSFCYNIAHMDCNPNSRGRQHVTTFFILMSCDKRAYLGFWITMLIPNLKKNYCHYNLHLTMSFLASTGIILQGEFTNINLTKSIHLLWQHSPGSLLALHEYVFNFSLCEVAWRKAIPGQTDRKVCERMLRVAMKPLPILPDFRRFRCCISKYKQSYMTRIKIIE